MGNTLLTYDALQESQVASGLMEAPVRSALDTWPIPMQMRRVVVSCMAPVPQFGPLYCAAAAADVHTPEYWRKKCADFYCNRTIQRVNPNPAFNETITSDQDPNTLFPAATYRGWNPPDPVLYFYGAGWGEIPDFDSYPSGDFSGGEASALWTDPTNGATVQDLRTISWDSGQVIAAMKNFLNGIRINEVWNGNPNGIVNIYEKNCFPGPTCVIPGQPGAAGFVFTPPLDPATINPQLDSFLDLRFDGNFHPISPDGDRQPPPGRFGSGNGMQTARCCTRFFTGDPDFGWSIPGPYVAGGVDPSGLSGGGFLLVDRMQVQPLFPVVVDLCERAWALHDVNASGQQVPIYDAVYKRVPGGGTLAAGQIFELPASSFTRPFTLGAWCISNIDVMILFNQTMEQWVAAQNANPAIGYHSYIVSAWS